MTSGIIYNSRYKIFVTQLFNIDQIVFGKKSTNYGISLRRNIKTWYLHQLKITTNLLFQILFLHVVLQRPTG